MSIDRCLVHDRQKCLDPMCKETKILEQCSTASPHVTHAWNGRPMKFCEGVEKKSEYATTKEELDSGIIRDPCNGWAIRND